jgi:hypothetical protein
MKLELEKQEIESIIAVLGDLPTKSNAWPLAVKVTEQLRAQSDSDEEAHAEADG